MAGRCENGEGINTIVEENIFAKIELYTGMGWADFVDFQVGLKNN